jgi:hypothetical protein
MKLISGWRNWWKLWSVRLNIAGIVLIAAEQMLTLWPIVPAETRALIPAWLPLPFFALAALARVIKQEKLNASSPTN